MHDTLVKKHEDGTAGSELGKRANYGETYNPGRLYPIPRAAKRIEIGINPDALPFSGFDCWNHYEVSWLNDKGKPIVATAEIYYDCHSPFIVESKSLKLYFNSFNNFKFTSFETVANIIKRDLQNVLCSEVLVVLHPLGNSIHAQLREKFSGICLDDLDITCDTYTVNPHFLTTESLQATETFYSDLLKSNCLVTNQPDWGSIQISYQGPQINREGLLRYLVSFRNHNEFHEQCIERIFIDIMNHCKPEELTVYGRYTRRGGLDINPYRSTQLPTGSSMNFRLLRQ